LTLSASIELELMRATMLLENDPAAAARQAIAVLASSPGHEAASLLLAAARRRLGGPLDALDSIESLARGEPTSPLLQLELGLTYAACDRTSESIAALERAVELDDQLAEGWRALSAQQLRAGNTAAADSAYARYRRVAADPPDLAGAYAAFDQGQLIDAESIARSRLPGSDNPVAAYTLLAAIAAKRGDNSAEEDALNRLLSLAPCDNGAREQLARLLLHLERSEVLPVIERLLLADPHSATVLILKAEALQLADRHDEALAIITGLLAREPHNPDYWLIAGNQQRFMGKTADAIQSYQRAIELRSGHGLAYWALSNLGTYSISTAEIAAMRRGLNAAPASSVDATHFEFALGRALEARLEFAESFEHYRRGNGRTRAGFSYDANSMTAFVNRFKSTFTRRFFAERSHWGDQAQDPIFIVGLPRSGSTLLEQILASHSQVEATRELAYIPAMARELAGSPETAARYPENMPALGQSDIEALAGRYLARVRAHRLQGKARFIDKMHGNFASLGLIQLMFPRAAIIDARRHPMGCGFACYKQLFVPGMNFAYDLNELGLYYRDYVDLMEHIDGVLPQRVYRLHYESLVADTANEVQRILAYCNLPFEPGCLRFHENKRVVQTISSQQVRQPIYTEGVDQWRHFEPWLEPLRQPLQALIEKYPRF
jgi:tetratricopeptide (TPR) repeat protein